LIDLVAEKFFGVSYDKNGELAARGKINEELLKVLMTIEEPFVDLKPPKTTGKEIYNLQYLEKATRSFEKINRYDLIATITFFTAWSIYENYRRHIIPKGLDTVYFNGGGVKNTTLMNHLKIFFEKANVKIAVDERFSKAKEAVCMAILAHEFLNGVSNNVPSATGAKESVVCGKIALPF
jgi:anhydro-N-acetylmuramic acid kinase